MIKHKDMEKTEALLIEYKNLLGTEDEASEKRKKEILAALKEDGTQETHEKIKALISAELERIDGDIKTIRERMDNEDYRLLPLSYIAKKYFGKSAAWLSQRINGTPVRGRVYTLSAEQKDIFNRAVKEIGERIGSFQIA